MINATFTVASSGIPCGHADGSARPTAMFTSVVISSTVTLPLAPFNGAWQPGGHKKTWYDAWYWPKEFGLRFFGSGTWSGTVRPGAPQRYYGTWH